jgi:hypothetical protein
VTNLGVGRTARATRRTWAWPKQLHRPTLDRVFTLDFLAKGENAILVGAQGLDKTMLAKTLVHLAVLAGHSARSVWSRLAGGARARGSDARVLRSISHRCWIIRPVATGPRVGARQGVFRQPDRPC